MATGTREIGRAEGAADVAVFASHIGMGTIQYEAGTKVIKRCLRISAVR